VRFYLRMHSGYALKIFCAFLPNLISGAPLFDDLVGTRERDSGMLSPIAFAAWSMFRKSGPRFPACAKPWHGWSFCLDASAGEGRSVRKCDHSIRLECFPGHLNRKALLRFTTIWNFWELHRRLVHFGAPQEAVDIGRSAPKQIRGIRSVRDQTARARCRRHRLNCGWHRGRSC
jgi:hypothetical protein